jgi:selenocysteine lyase/cysteine desulfurase
MSLYGPQATDDLDIDAMIKKYNPSELVKFKAILKAEQEGHPQQADELAEALSPLESQHLDLYLADMQRIREYQQSLQSKLVEGQRKIDGLQSSIASDEKKIATITHQYGAKMATKQQPARTNGHSNGHTATNGKKEKKKGGACTLM